MRTPPIGISVVLAFAVLSVAPRHAAAQACTPVTSVPTEITHPGSYCFTSTLHLAAASGNRPAIVIRAPDVTIDLQGLALEGEGVSLGIQAYEPATIRNGSIRGFATAINMNVGTKAGATIERIVYWYFPNAPQATDSHGIYVNSYGAAVRGCTVVYRHMGTHAFSAIYVSGYAASIADNRINVTRAGSAPSITGIQLVGAGQLDGNQVDLYGHPSVALSVTGTASASSNLILDADVGIAVPVPGAAGQKVLTSGNRLVNVPTATSGPVAPAVPL